MVSKRIIVCCDGTGNTLEPAGRRGKDFPTNVLRLARLIHPYDPRGQVTIQQVMLYLPGVGISGVFDRCMNGIRGRGVELKVLIAYQFITDNYVAGDDLFIFGFSRGAFTARLLVDFLNTVKVIPKAKMREFDRIYADYKRSLTGRRLPRDVDEYGVIFEKLSEREQEVIKHIPVRFLGVWDTVTTLSGAVEEAAVPTTRKIRDRIKDFPITVIQWLKDRSDEERLGFGSIAIVPGIVTEACQALALHEIRTKFPPALWTRAARQETHVTQTWFAGAHSDIGGGYEDSNLSDMTLEWMIARAGRHGLYVDVNRLPEIGPRVPKDLPRFLRPIHESCYDKVFDWIQFSVRKRTFGRTLNEYRHASVDARVQYAKPFPRYSNKQYERAFREIDQDSMMSLPLEPKDDAALDQRSFQEELAFQRRIR